MIVRHEEIVHGIGVAARALEPAHVPHVHEGGAGGGEQHGPLHELAVGRPARASVRLGDGAVRAQPRRVSPAAREAPGARDPVAAVDGDGPRAGPRAPREHGPSVATEDLHGHVVREIGGGHRASRGLTETPCRARVGLGDLLHHPGKGDGIDLAAVEGAGQEQAEEARLEERGQHRLGQPPLLLDLIGAGLDLRSQGARSFDIVDLFVRFAHGSEYSAKRRRRARRPLIASPRRT